MEVRMRTAVSRTAKGYSVEATIDINGDVGKAEANPNKGLVQPEETETLVNNGSAFEIKIWKPYSQGKHDDA